MALVIKLLFAAIGLASVLSSVSYSADAPKQKKAISNANRPEKPVHLVVKSRAEIKQIFAYSSYPAVPSELEGYAGSQMAATRTYRTSVDTRRSEERRVGKEGRSRWETYH